jgi:hypothetical protein
MKAGEKELYLKQNFWRAGGEITVQQALLGASALTHAAVKALADANKVIIEIPQGWLAGEFRFYSDSADNTSDIVELYAASTSDSKPDHYRHVATLTLTNGTQEKDANTFIDTINAAITWLTNKGAVSPADNTFASFAMNFHGHSHILAIASTLGSTTLGMEYKKV